MALKADAKYNGKVTDGSHIYVTQTGTLGYQVMLEWEDGDTYFVIWLTEKNRARASKYFEILGVNAEKLKSQAYLEYQLALDIAGKEVSFGTRTEEYNGKTTIKVAWIGKKFDPNLVRGAASFFGGDDDIPF